MKKPFIIILIITALLLVSGVSLPAQAGGVVVRAQRQRPADIAYYYRHENIVYVTNSGKKYHKQGCSYLKSSHIMISLEQAGMEGKEPCSRCFGDNGD